MHLKSLIKSCLLSEKFSFQKPKKLSFVGNFLTQRKRRTKMFPLNKMFNSLNSICCRSFSFLSCKMEKFQKSSFDWEILNCLPDLGLFARFLKLFKSTAMLTLTSPTNSGCFIAFEASRCNAVRLRKNNPAVIFSDSTFSVKLQWPKVLIEGSTSTKSIVFEEKNSANSIELIWRTPCMKIA